MSVVSIESECLSYLMRDVWCERWSIATLNAIRNSTAMNSFVKQKCCILSFLLEYASSPPEKMSNKTNKKLKFPMIFRHLCKVKPILLYCTPFPARAFSVLGLFLVHIWQVCYSSE